MKKLLALSVLLSLGAYSAHSYEIIFANAAVSDRYIPTQHVTNNDIIHKTSLSFIDDQPRVGIIPINRLHRR